MRKRVIQWLCRVLAFVRAIPPRVRVFIASLHIPRFIGRVSDDIRYLFLGRYLPASYAALLAYERTETNEVGKFVYDFCDGNNERILEYHIHWMIQDGIVYGRTGPSRQWGPVGTRGNIRILSNENTATTRHAVPRCIYDLRVSRYDFASFMKALAKMTR